jgi:uncharacterized repeat protein (TIGR03803 family)
MGTNPGDPLYPREIGVIARGPDGSLYTTSQQGGKYNRGTVFKITPDGKLTVLHSFEGPDGAGPTSGLVMGRDGNLYGTAYGSGAKGCGTIFRITPDGAFTTLHSFASGTDGAFPSSAPKQGKDGNFYGITPTGIYKITSTGQLTPLFQFTRTTVATLGNGAMDLIAGSDGNFYGTMLKGGAGFGTIIKVTPSGNVTALHVFDGNHGSVPYSLIQGSDGNLYGTATQGVGYTGPSGFGLVYKLTPGGDYTVLHTFSGADGSNPVATVIEGSDGNLYGDTKGGSKGGVIYRLAKNGSNFQVLHTFKATEAFYDTIPLVQDIDGRFYGDSYQGGSKLTGSVYVLDMGLKPLPTPAP